MCMTNIPKQKKKKIDRIKVRNTQIGAQLFLEILTIFFQ